MFDALKNTHFMTTEVRPGKKRVYICSTFCGFTYKKTLSHTITLQKDGKSLFRRFDVLTGRRTEEGFLNEEFKKVGKWNSYDLNGEVEASTVYDENGKNTFSEIYQRNLITGALDVWVQKRPEAFVKRSFKDGKIDSIKIQTLNSDVSLDYLDGHLKSKSLYDKERKISKLYLYTPDGRKQSIRTVTSSGMKITHFFANNHQR